MCMHTQIQENIFVIKVGTLFSLHWLGVAYLVEDCSHSDIYVHKLNVKFAIGFRE